VIGGAIGEDRRRPEMWFGGLRSPGGVGIRDQVANPRIPHDESHVAVGVADDAPCDVFTSLGPRERGKTFPCAPVGDRSCRHDRRISRRAPSVVVLPPGMAVRSAACAARCSGRRVTSMGRRSDHQDRTDPERTGAGAAIGSPSFGELYQEWRHVVWAAARLLLPCDDDADDAVERVFLRMLRRPNRVPKAGLNNAYFRRAGRNEALLLQRGRQRELSIHEEILETIPARAPLPDDLLHIKEVGKRLEGLVDALPPRCAGIMKLRLEGASNPEIAQALGISVRAVEKQAARGRHLLDEALALRGGGVSHFLDGRGRDL
jgi:RNA polymerase sigma factor (sigma-70 family)